LQARVDRVSEGVGGSRGLGGVGIVGCWAGCAVVDHRDTTEGPRKHPLTASPNVTAEAADSAALEVASCRTTRAVVDHRGTSEAPVDRVSERVRGNGCQAAGPAVLSLAAGLRVPLWTTDGLLQNRVRLRLRPTSFVSANRVRPSRAISAGQSGSSIV
jgi:hypothetical protein